MNDNILGKKDLLRIEILFINLSLLFFIFRTAIPIFKYPFLFLFSCNVIYIIVFRRYMIIGELKQFIWNFFLILIIVCVHVLAFLFSDKSYLIVFKELTNSFVLLALFFMLSMTVNTAEKLGKYLDDLLDLIILFGLGISLLGILDVLAIFSINENLEIDYNFALLPVYFSIIAVIYKKTKTESFKNTILYNILCIVFIVQILFSGSRRGLIMGIAVTAALLIIQLYYFLNRKKLKGKEIERISRESIFISLSFVLIPLIFSLFLLKSTFLFKENALSLIRTKDKAEVKYNIAHSIYRYISIIRNIDFPDVYQSIWSPPFLSIDAGSWWKDGRCKTLFPLTGENVKIVPPGSHGIVIDSNCIDISKNRNLYTNRLINRLKTKKGEIVETSVYCYVSKNFNGSSVKISFTGSGIGEELFKEYGLYNPQQVKTRKDFNLLENGDFKKGTLFWTSTDSIFHQIIDTPFGKGIRVTRTSGEGNWSLKYDGRPIIYHAGHEYLFNFYYKVIKGRPVPFSIGWWLDDGGQGVEPTLTLPLEIKHLANGWNEVKCSYRFKETNIASYTFLNSFLSHSVADFADIKLYDLDSNSSLPTFADEDRGWWQKLQLSSQCKNGSTTISLSVSGKPGAESESIQGFVIFAYPEFRIINQDQVPESSLIFRPNYDTYFSSSHGTYNAGLLNFHLKIPESIFQDSIEKDKIRLFASRLISQDTTYHGYSSELSVDTISNSFLDLRVRRWQFAVQIFLKEYGFLRKLFGGGFNHLNWYGYYFDNDKTATDYPHNPLFSVLLYSGIVGLFLYLLLLSRTIRYYYLHFKRFYVLAIFFLISSFFSFFSAGNPLDPPVMGFLIIMATFIHSAYGKFQNPNRN